jgi:hypothetical protein
VDTIFLGRQRDLAAAGAHDGLATKVKGIRCIGIADVGAREDLLEAARTLTRRGLVPFSPAQLISEVQRRGSRYPEVTLRTFIAGPMCSNSPSNHAVQYDDLIRVGHGRYVLAENRNEGPHEPPDDPATFYEAEAKPSNQPIVVDQKPTTPDWFWEGNVQANVVAYLVENGWSILRVADTKSSEHGIDVSAQRGDVRLLVEVKGYPSKTYARGEKAGQPKLTPPALQARQYFSNALLSGHLLRSENPTARVVLSFPKLGTFSGLAQRIWRSLYESGVEVWLIDESGLPTTPEGAEYGIDGT